MGMYTGIRFKGTVAERFRKGFEVIAMEGEWDNFDDEYFDEFSDNNSRSSFIPRGGLYYMPKQWETGTCPNEVATDGFERSYNEETGYWTFQCSLKNYGCEIEQFFELLPYFIESIEHLEYFYEEDDYSQRYELVNREVIRTNVEFIKYGY